MKHLLAAGMGTPGGAQALRGLCVAALLAGAAPLAGQVEATVRGVVRSAITGEPIPGAVVRVVGTSVVNQTGVDGSYALLSVPLGVSVLRVTHPEHVGIAERLTVEAPALVVRDFELMAPAFVLEEIVARAMRRQVDIPDRTIQGEELQGNRGVREVLDGVTGVTLVRTGGAVGMGYYLRVRGAKSFSFNRHPVVFIDGVRVQALGYDGGLGALELIDPGTIARIEVLKGPAAGAEYGPDAADGVVLITTRRGGRGR
ncbi:MAG: TonB-dependent receptor plug domain-containing protein [Gemmatimonadetes bacterium]|nr:TonB-dependent receptor plug domain-containing protein [Gemmatimonadota bacterium]MCY3677867.1 TonB-dependent receptor plug domain-containing protein [Gemmatimonadota bacterium]MYA42906.1 TonB-dependent receptor plug domain-containing protein [Gemmatimonadota bacterium]MYE93733.1 TonB-dependent receptor plug domain-containing protein [Gemmatimonadota bacterium]MYJ09404.1 TonB-dependent receptor plug domain-containing protein [Gemmatimonadota bacterium]